MYNRQGLVAETSSEVYIAPGADHQMLSVKLCGPSLDNNSAELVADQSKADMTKLKDRLSRVNWGEEGMNLQAESEWDKFKEILDRKQQLEKKEEGEQTMVDDQESQEDDKEEEEDVKN